MPNKLYNKQVSVKGYSTGGRIEKVPGGYSKEGSGRISDKGLKGRSPTEAFKQKEMFKGSSKGMKVKKAMGGSLKPVDKNKNPGLAKLPTQVRNKMGYMKDGGKVMRKAGLNVGETLKQFKDLMTGSKDSKMSKQKENLKKQIAEGRAKMRDEAKVKYKDGGLTGGQKKLDVNNDGKISGEDFKILKGKNKKMRGGGIAIKGNNFKGVF